jgi:hypothetical protein
MRELLRRLVAVGFERVDAQVERRARGERHALLDAFGAEGRRKLAVEPFRIVTEDMWRRAVEARGREARALVVGERCGREARAVAQRRDRVDTHGALALEHAEQHSARLVVTHDEGGRCAPSQRVVDEARDHGAVARAREAVRQAPVLQGIARGAAPRLDVGEGLDRRGETRCRCHGNRRSMRTAKYTHMISRMIVLTKNTRARVGTWLEPVWI